MTQEGSSEEVNVPQVAVVPSGGPEDAQGRHYKASRTCLADTRGSNSRDLKSGVRLKIARALACRSKTQKA